MTNQKNTTLAVNKHTLFNNTVIEGKVIRNNSNPFPQRVFVQQTLLDELSDEKLVKAISSAIADPKYAKRYGDQGIWFPSKNQIEIKLMGSFGDVRVQGYLVDDSDREKVYELTNVLMHAHSPKNQRRFK